MLDSSRRSAARHGALRYKAVIVSLAVSLLALVALVAEPALAQSAELRRADVVKQLDAQYAEAPTAVGVTNRGRVIEVFTTGDGSTWTLVLTRPDGTSRVIAAGQTWVKR